MHVREGLLATVNVTRCGKTNHFDTTIEMHYRCIYSYTSHQITREESNLLFHIAFSWLCNNSEKPI